MRLCETRAPYHGTRRTVRELIEQHSAFIEIHVATPLEVCEARDTARGGDIDLYVEVTRPVPPRLRARLVSRLEQQIANHVDIVIHEPGSADTPIFRIARQTGVRPDDARSRSYAGEHPIPS